LIESEENFGKIFDVIIDGSPKLFSQQKISQILNFSPRLIFHNHPSNKNHDKLKACPLT
jgi:hypothetical protein